MIITTIYMYGEEYSMNLTKQQLKQLIREEIDNADMYTSDVDQAARGDINAAQYWYRNPDAEPIYRVIRVNRKTGKRATTIGGEALGRAGFYGCRLDVETADRLAADWNEKYPEFEHIAQKCERTWFDGHE